MDTFDLYGTAWLIYLVLGLSLLALIMYKIKDLSWNIKFAITSFLAVGAFTPDLVTDASTYAPLIITALLNAEVEGSSAIISALIRLVALWGGIFFSALGIRHYLKTKRLKK